MINENFEETYLFYKSLNKTWMHFWIWQIVSSYIPNDFRGWEVFDSNNSGILHLSSSVGGGTSLCCHRSLEEEKVSTTTWQDKLHTQQGFAETSVWICGLILAYRVRSSAYQNHWRKELLNTQKLCFLTSASIGVLTKESTLDLQLLSVVKPIIFWVRLFFPLCLYSFFKNKFWL